MPLSCENWRPNQRPNPSWQHHSHPDQPLYALNVHNATFPEIFGPVQLKILPQRHRGKHFYFLPCLCGKKNDCEVKKPIDRIVCIQYTKFDDHVRNPFYIDLGIQSRASRDRNCEWPFTNHPLICGSSSPRGGILWIFSKISPYYLLNRQQYSHIWLIDWLTTVCRSSDWNIPYMVIPTGW